MSKRRKSRRILIPEVKNQGKAGRKFAARSKEKKTAADYICQLCFGDGWTV
jgi:hypothetical protein